MTVQQFKNQRHPLYGTLFTQRILFVQPETAKYIPNHHRYMYMQGGLESRKKFGFSLDWNGGFTGFT